MSIFKDTLNDQVYAQLKARQNIVSGENNNKSPLLPWYLSKNSWVRMTSFTNYNEGPVTFDGKGKITTDITKGHYKGDQLSKKYILQGGTLYTKDHNGKTIGALRKGLLGDDAVYGGNIDFHGNSQDEYFRRFGIRPMPGITSVNMNTKSAYGSLYQTTIKYYAWDVHQLNELELLFMRPGYSVLLEWGWSQYIDNKGTPQVFQGGTINPFDTSLTQQRVYNKMQGAREKWDYNYDAMLGYVTNFNWSLMPNGGYECTTTLISMGEVMSTLKINSAANKNSKSEVQFNPNEEKYYYDDYENILLSIKSKAEIAYNSYNGNQYLEEEAYKGKWAISNRINDKDIAQKLRNFGWTIEADRLLEEPLIKFLKAPEEKTAGAQGTVYEYISLPVWIAIMDSYFSYNVSSTEKLVKFQPIGAEDYCLAGKDSISTDLSICAVNNPTAFPEFAHIKPSEYKESGINPMLNQHKWYSDDSVPVVTPPSFYDSGKNVGIPGYIYVNLDLLLNEYTALKNSSSEDGVELMVYVQNVLNKVSNALGGLNNFKLSTAGRDQNVLRVIDLYYLEQKAPLNSKKKIDLFGLKSICRDVKIESKIFENQSTIVAIAAQSRANLGDIYNSSQVYLNAGLEDRLALAKWQGEENNNPAGDKAEGQEDPIYQKLLDFLISVKRSIIGEPDSKGWKIDPNTAASPPSGFLKSFMLRFNGEMNFKALIPFTLKITIDGLSGFVVGQIFTVDQNVLPRNYYDKKLGFIITKISHDLSNNDWSTTLETQICILDQEGFFDSNGNPKLTADIKREGFEEFLEQAKIDAILYPILSDFIEFQFNKSLAGYIYSSISSDNPNELLIDYIIDPDKDDWDQYWIYGQDNNIRTKTPEQIKGFLNSGTYNFSQFEKFTYDWVQRYKKQHPNKLSIQVNSDKTLGQILDELTKTESSSIIAGDLYVTYRKNVEKIISIFNDPNTLKQFYPGDGSVLWATPNPFKGDGDYALFLTNAVGYDAQNYEIDYPVLRTRIQQYISSQVPSVIQYYNNLNTVEGTPLNTLFIPGASNLYVPLKINDNSSLKNWGGTINWATLRVNGNNISEKLAEDITNY